MAKGSKLKDTAVKIGSTIGRVDGTAHKAAHRAVAAAKVAKAEFIELSKQLEVLKKQLNKSSKRLKRALQG